MPPSSATLLDNFFCFSLHTGSVVLGWLGLCSSIISVISWSVSFQNIDGFIKEHFNVTGNDTDDNNWQPADIDFMRSAAVSIISMLIGFYVIECLASIFLIHGASNNKRMYLVPWLVERGTQLFFYMMVILAMGLYFFTSLDTIKFSLVTIVFGGFYLIFNLYCFLCVYSLFALMREYDENRPLIAPGSSNPNYVSSGTTYVKI